MLDPNGSDGLPPFEDVVASDDVARRVYDTILQVRELTSVEAIADAADCDPETARKFLTWFTELRIITRRDGQPATFERNDAYFDWRRVNELAATHSDAELRDRIQDLTAGISEYEDRGATLRRRPQSMPSPLQRRVSGRSTRCTSISVTGRPRMNNGGSTNAPCSNELLPASMSPDSGKCAMVMLGPNSG